MIKLWLKILFFIIFSVASADLYAQYNGITDKQIITSEMIKAAGTISLADILNLADKWSFTSIDGFTKYAAANSLSSYQRQNFTVMIDGQKYQLNLFDNQNINLLPISITQVDYVEIFNTPGIANGEFTEGGIIHFHTKKAVKGLSVAASEIVGNETGDPGPYRYTQLATPNIDKVGPFFSTALNYGSKNWYAQASYKNEETFDTDPFINSRVAFLNTGSNKAALNSGWGNVFIFLPNGNINFSGGLSNHSNFFFFKPLGYEIPAERSITHLAGKGVFNFENNLSFNYSVVYSTNELNKLDNTKNFNFDLNINSITANFESILKERYFTSFCGITIDEYRIFSGKTVEQNKYSFKSIYGGVTLNPTPDFSQTLNLYFKQIKSKYALKASLTNSWQINKLSSLSSSFSFYEHLPEEDMSYWSLYNKGYNLSKDLGISYNVLGNPGKAKNFTADLTYKTSFDSLFTTSASVIYRDFRHNYIEQQNFQYYPDESVLSGPVELYSNEYLKTAGAEIEFIQKLSKYFNQKLVYNYQKDLSGSQAFSQTWQQIPHHTLSYILQYNPSETFGIWLKIKYFSSSVWEDYKYTDYQSNGLYSSKLKPKVMFDISFEKWFVHRMIWANLMMRNVFNQNEKYNPIGVNLNLTDFFQVHIYFDSLPE